MAENPDDKAGDNEKARLDAATQDGNGAVGNNLPMVVAPKLGAGEDEAVDEELGGQAPPGPAASDAAAHTPRFLVLAGLVAFAAAFGSFIGSVSGSGLVRFLDPASPAPAVGVSAEATRQMKLELAELATIKANIEATSHSTSVQLAKLSDRFDRLGQHTTASPETTGSIAPAPQPAAAQKLADRVLPDWTVQGVEAGRALVQSRYGGLFDVGEGSTLPGVGRINAIRRQDGQWIVLTERGTITSGH